jgi:hypothetical protein
MCVNNYIGHVRLLAESINYLEDVLFSSIEKVHLLLLRWEKVILLAFISFHSH